MFTDLDDFEKFALIVDYVDNLLEKVDSSLDSIKSVKNSNLPPGSSAVIAPRLTVHL
jgi:hypothetical protein